MLDRPPANVLFSVCIPVRDDASNLRECLAGFRSQDRSYTEILVCDDGSTAPCSPITCETWVSSFVCSAKRPSDPRCQKPSRADRRRQIPDLHQRRSVPRPDMLECAKRIVTAHPDLNVFYGSYADEPTDRTFVSSYHHLLHHFTHRIRRGGIKP